MVAIPIWLLAVVAISYTNALPYPLGTISTLFQSRQAARLHVAYTDVSAKSKRAAMIDVGGGEAFRSILGPVVAKNFPDPAVIYHEGISYAFATNNKGHRPEYGSIHIQVATSTDNQTWTLMQGYDALPSVGNWASGHRVWAPDVNILDDGTFVMYYSDDVTWARRHHCIGVATSSTITGPYQPRDEPFACPDPLTQGGAIDPDGFLDPSTGRRYVTYKVDGNSIGHGGLCHNSVEPIVPTPIHLQEVNASDGVTKIGDPRTILDRDHTDGPLIEAPSLHRSEEGVYFLFFSSNCFTTPKYDTSYATAYDIEGPYTKSHTPLFTTGDGPGLLGPGGTDIVKGGDLIVFHGHIDHKNILGNLAVLHGEEKNKKAGSENIVKRHDKDKDDAPVRDPLVRGMYTAVATFNGTRVMLTGPKPGF